MRKSSEGRKRQGMRVRGRKIGMEIGRSGGGRRKVTGRKGKYEKPRGKRRECELEERTGIEKRSSGTGRADWQRLSKIRQFKLLLGIAMRQLVHSQYPFFRIPDPVSIPHFQNL